MRRMVHSRFTPKRRWWSATNCKRITSASPRRNTSPGRRRNTSPPCGGSRVPPPARGPCCAGPRSPPPAAWRLGGYLRPATPGPTCPGRRYPVPQRLRVDPQISGNRPDRRSRARLVQRDRIRLELRRVALHDHETSFSDPQDPLSRVSKIRGQGPRSGQPGVGALPRRRYWGTTAAMPRRGGSIMRRMIYPY